MSTDYEKVCFKNWQEKNAELKQLQKEFNQMREEFEKLKIVVARLSVMTKEALE